MDNKEVPVVILCGGRGYRMGSLTYSRPKCLIPVRDNALLWYSLNHFRHFGFRRFILPLGYGSEQIRHWLSLRTEFAECHFTLLDTGLDSRLAQRLKQALPSMKSDTTFFLANSDTICRFDLRVGLARHRNSRGSVTLMTMPVRSHWGLIIEHRGCVVGFERDSLIRNVNLGEGSVGRINSGFAIISRLALEAELGWLLDVDSDNYEQDFYGTLAQRGDLNYIFMPQFWMAFDTPKDLVSANEPEAAKEIDDIVYLYKS